MQWNAANVMPRAQAFGAHCLRRLMEGPRLGLVQSVAMCAVTTLLLLAIAYGAGHGDKPPSRYMQVKSITLSTVSFGTSECNLIHISGGHPGSTLPLTFFSPRMRAR